MADPKDRQVISCRKLRSGWCLEFCRKKARTDYLWRLVKGEDVMYIDPQDALALILNEIGPLLGDY